jgi:hypothetical protein
LSAVVCEILPACIGSKASFLTSAKVGAITKIVRKSAMPTRTWFGGADGVPRPERMKPRTIRIRVKPVTVKSSAGTSVTPASRTRIWTALPVSASFIAAPSACAGAP